MIDFINFEINCLLDIKAKEFIKNNRIINRINNMDT